MPTWQALAACQWPQAPLCLSSRAIGTATQSDSHEPLPVSNSSLPRGSGPAWHRSIDYHWLSLSELHMTAGVPPHRCGITVCDS